MMSETDRKAVISLVNDDVLRVVDVDILTETVYIYYLSTSRNMKVISIPYKRFKNARSKYEYG